MINIIESKLKIRESFFDQYEKSWNEEKLNYDMEEPKEIDELGEEIHDLLSIHHKNLPVDFILETLAKLGGDVSILYDDNGNFAIGTAGYSSVSTEPSDCSLTFFVEKDNWKPTIREAISVLFENFEE